MSDQGYRPPPRKKNALDVRQLKLTAAPVNGSRRPPTLGVSVVKNQPRFDIWTNVDGDKNKGRITAKMDTPTFMAVITLIKQAVTEEPGWRMSVENQNHTFYNGKRSEKPELESTTIVGKDDQGQIFLSVIDKDRERPKIKFVIKPTQYHALKHGDGRQYDEAETSKVYARAYSELLSELIPTILIDEYEDTTPPGGYGNKGGQSNYNNSNQGGGNSESKPAFDEDLPF